MTHHSATHPITLDVALNHMVLPIEPDASTACIVVDVIRATTTLTVFVERGWPEILVARSVVSARHAAQRQSDQEYVIFGEVDGLPLKDFAAGNSPADVAALTPDHRTPILVTTNGTVALHRCEHAGLTLAGCLRNAHAVAVRALSFVRQSGGAILLVCSGRGPEPALDDTLCAGVICQEVTDLAGDVKLAIEDGAHIALGVVEGVRNVAARATVLDLSAAARHVKRVGQERDLEWCTAANVTTAVPYVAGREGDLLVVKPMGD